VNPTLNRIVIFGWPLVALCVLVPVLKGLHTPPTLILLAVVVLCVAAAAIQVFFLDIPESWLETEEEREKRRSKDDRRNPAHQR
jgi:hypothetical protein